MRNHKGVPVAVLLLVLFVTAGCNKQRAEPKSALRTAGVRTFSSFDAPAPGEKVLPAQTIKFEQADLAKVLNLYAEISGRSIILAGNLPNNLKVTFSNQTPMTAVEALQALDTVLAAQDIAMVFLGTQYVKAVPANTACMEPAPVMDLRPEQLPDSSSFLIYIVKLKKATASDAAPALQPFAKLPNSIIGIGGSGGRPASGVSLQNLPSIIGLKDHGVLILRDYSSTVRRMLQVLEKLEQQ